MTWINNLHNPQTSGLSTRLRDLHEKGVRKLIHLLPRKGNESTSTSKKIGEKESRTNNRDESYIRRRFIKISEGDD